MQYKLNIFFSNNNIYFQIVDNKQNILISASTTEKSLKNLKKKSNIDNTIILTFILAKRAKYSGIQNLILNNHYKYNGKFKIIYNILNYFGISLFKVKEN
jgi:ribosomal protein L18